MFYRIAGIILLLLFAYFLGHSNCQTQILTKETEVTKYVSKQNQKITSAPHAGKSDILKLMRTGQL